MDKKPCVSEAHGLALLRAESFVRFRFMPTFCRWARRLKQALVALRSVRGHDQDFPSRHVEVFLNFAAAFESVVRQQTAIKFVFPSPGYAPLSPFTPVDSSKIFLSCRDLAQAALWNSKAPIHYSNVFQFRGITIPPELAVLLIKTFSAAMWKLVSLTKITVGGIMHPNPLHHHGRFFEREKVKCTFRKNLRPDAV